MKLNISTTISEKTLRETWNEGYVTLESEYGWVCPGCGNYTKEYVLETFSHYRNMRDYSQIITRVLTLHNDGEDWLCKDCKSPEGRKRRLLMKEHTL